jgi:serine/threonine protein kinase
MDQSKVDLNDGQSSCRHLSFCTTFGQLHSARELNLALQGSSDQASHRQDLACRQPVAKRALIAEQRRSHHMRVPLPTAIRSSPPAQMGRFKRGDKLGQGTYGTVYRGRDKVSGDAVAMKLIALTPPHDGFPVDALRELAVLQACRHPNLQPLLHVLATDTHVVIVTPLADYDLRHRLRIRTLSGDLLRSLAFQLLCAVNYLHAHLIVHRDVTAANVLVFRTGWVRLADFGISRRLLPSRTRPLTCEVVTAAYRPPELFLRQLVYDHSVDIWSLGVLFVEMATGQLPFGCNQPLAMLNQIFRVLGTPSESDWPGFGQLCHNISFTAHPRAPLPLAEAFQLQHHEPEFAALLERMLVPCPSLRISAADALRLPYFAAIPLALAANAAVDGTATFAA